MIFGHGQELCTEKVSIFYFQAEYNLEFISFGCYKDQELLNSKTCLNVLKRRCAQITEHFINVIYLSQSETEYNDCHEVRQVAFFFTP